MTLSETEKFALGRINADYARMTALVFKDIEARLGLPAGSLGQMYAIQPDGSVVMTPEGAAHFARMAAEPLPNGHAAPAPSEPTAS
jgi:hypothetical protein